MDYIVYDSKPHGTTAFPSVVATPSAPKSLYDAEYDLVYVNTGSGWQPAVQPSTGSVYSAYSGASASTQASIQTSIANVSIAPTAAHKTVATQAVNVAVRGR